MAKLEDDHTHLRAAQAAADGSRPTPKAVVVGFIVGLLVGWLVGEAAYASRNHTGAFPNAFHAVPIDWAANAVGLLAGLLVWGVFAALPVLDAKARLNAARNRVVVSVDALRARFQTEVAAWGGLGVLHDPDIVHLIWQELGTSGPPTATPQATTSEGRRRGLSAALARLNTTYATIGNEERWTFGFTAVFGIFAAVPLGLTAALAFDASVRWTIIPIVAAIWAAYVYIVRSRVKASIEALKKQADVQVTELTADFPDEAAAWGGRAALRDPATAHQLRQELDPTAGPSAPVSSTSVLSADELVTDPARRAVLVARLREHAHLLKGTKDNTDVTWAGLVFLWLFAVPTVGGLASALPKSWDPDASMLVMVALGVPAGAVTAAVSWWGMACVRRHLARKRDEAVARFVADYPKAVEAWGGRGVMESLEAVVALLKTYDAGGTPRPGFLRRMFGG